MPTQTIPTLARISPQELASLLRSPPNQGKIAIIDVRDSDYIGGHIKSCLNVPVQTHDYRMPELVRNLKDKEMVVFHCALSQQRGPSSALRFLRERERMGARGEVGVRGDGEDLGAGQRVVVLEGGFVKWQELYGLDLELTEGYVKDLWDDKW
ncbi:hypothetical protein LTR62_008851 [Meristemomyces frigidus]|uniref:Rhodanese domain-containing protein n=1 Tax=Meristemomyces frigidus TaxID=1508187 RepID=A0AAN7TA67_9PEZI|nr:hypothetical protein LTR62_008851 [Meristemomyces frigidus]